MATTRAKLVTAFVTELTEDAYSTPQAMREGVNDDKDRIRAKAKARRDWIGGLFRACHVALKRTPDLPLETIQGRLNAAKARLAHTHKRSTWPTGDELATALSALFLAPSPAAGGLLLHPQTETHFVERIKAGKRPFGSSWNDDAALDLARRGLVTVAELRTAGVMTRALAERLVRGGAASLDDLKAAGARWRGMDAWRGKSAESGAE